MRPPTPGIIRVILKYADDLTVAEAMNLPEKLIKDPDRPRDRIVTMQEQNMYYPLKKVMFINK